jgi:DNA-binding response OmpR family regulator
MATKKIAIIEDDTPIAQMYQLKFEAEGYQVGVAGNGREGLDLIEKLKPDVALVDLMMPEMTGDEMLAELRKTDHGKKIRVIILTNVSRDEASKTLEKMDISGYIVKAHHTPQQVVDMAESVLRIAKRI